MADPTGRIGAAKGTAGRSNSFRFPDNVGDPKSGGQHFMLIKSWIMDDPRMTTSQVPMVKRKGIDPEKMNEASAHKSYAFYIPPGALKQQYDGKYNTLAFGAVSIGAVQGGMDVVSSAYTEAQSKIREFFQQAQPGGQSQGAGAVSYTHLTLPTKA